MTNRRPGSKVTKEYFETHKMTVEDVVGTSADEAAAEAEANKKPLSREELIEMRRQQWEAMHGINRED